MHSGSLHVPCKQMEIAKKGHFLGLKPRRAGAGLVGVLRKPLLVRLPVAWGKGVGAPNRVEGPEGGRVDWASCLGRGFVPKGRK